MRTLTIYIYSTNLIVEHKINKQACLSLSLSLSNQIYIKHNHIEELVLTVNVGSIHRVQLLTDQKGCCCLWLVSKS